MGGVFQNSALTTTVQYMYNTIPDADAQTFITAANITNGIQKIAINTLVIDLKGYGLWTKQKALYPIVGGTSAAHAVNLRTPGTYNLSFTGGWTHSSTGMTPNGTSDYANTGLNANTVLTNFNTSVSTYLRTNNSGLYFDIGAANDAGSTQIISIYGNYLGNTLADTGNYITSRISVATTDSRGFYTIKRTANNNLKLFKNGIQIGSNINTDNALLVSKNILISAAEIGGTYLQFSNRQCAFASIGDGLTDAEAANFYTAVQKFQTLLGRQV